MNEFNDNEAQIRSLQDYSSTLDEQMAEIDSNKHLYDESEYNSLMNEKMQAQSDAINRIYELRGDGNGSSGEADIKPVDTDGDKNNETLNEEPVDMENTNEEPIDTDGDENNETLNEDSADVENTNEDQVDTDSDVHEALDEKSDNTVNDSDNIENDSIE